MRRHRSYTDSRKSQLQAVPSRRAAYSGSFWNALGRTAELHVVALRIENGSHLLSNLFELLGSLLFVLAPHDHDQNRSDERDDYADDDATAAEVIPTEKQCHGSCQQHQSGCKPCECYWGFSSCLQSRPRSHPAPYVFPNSSIIAAAYLMPWRYFATWMFSSGAWRFASGLAKPVRTQGIQTWRKIAPSADTPFTTGSSP